MGMKINQQPVKKNSSVAIKRDLRVFIRDLLGEEAVEGLNGIARETP